MDTPAPLDQPDDADLPRSPGDAPGLQPRHTPELTGLQPRHTPELTGLQPRHTPEQRRLLRRVLLGFVAVVVLLPFIGLGGVWAVLLVPALVAAVVAFRAAMQLRRTVR